MDAIPTAAFFDRAGAGMAALRRRAESLQAQVATGNRLARGSDDPVAAARLRALSRENALADVDAFNSGRAETALALADETLGRIGDAMGRVRELAVLAASGTLNSSQRAAIGVEVAQLGEQVFALANARDADGNALFGGAGTGAAYVRDAAGNAAYAGSGSAGSVELGEGLSVTKSLTGPEFLSFAGASGPTDLMATIKLLADALGGAVADPAAAARDALGALDAAQEKLGTGQAVIGARLAWVDLASERRAGLGDLRVEEQARTGGTDLASTIAALQNAMLALEASQASFARMSGLSLFNHLR